MTTQPPPKGKGMTYGIIGCVVLLLVCGCCGGVGAIYMFMGGGDAAKVADEFLADLDKGDVAAATALSTAPITKDELTTLSKTYREDAGGFADHSFSSTNYHNELCDLEGIAHFKGDKSVDFRLKMQLSKVDGKWKVNLIETQKK